MRSITYIHDTWIVQEQRKEEGKKEFETYDEQRKCVIIDTLRDPCRYYGCQRRCRCRRQCWNVSGSSLNYLLTNHRTQQHTGNNLHVLRPLQLHYKVQQRRDEWVMQSNANPESELRASERMSIAALHTNWIKPKTMTETMNAVSQSFGFHRLFVACALVECACLSMAGEGM